jgi:hypothetical protein
MGLIRLLCSSYEFLNEMYNILYPNISIVTCACKQ